MAEPSDELTALLVDAIGAWEKSSGAELLPATRSMAIAEALLAVTWARPHAHACLTLLLDEERHAALANFHQEGGTA